HCGRPRPGSRPPRGAAALMRARLAHAAAPGAPWPAGAGSPAPMPLSTFVTVRFLSNLTVTREPSAFFMCASYTPSPASVSIRYTVPPGTALSAAARSVAAVALDTLFSSGRTGWAPPGPGVLALPVGDDT